MKFTLPFDYAGFSLSIWFITILTVILKLTGHVDWSWAWVLAPLWAPIVFTLVAAFVIALAWVVAVVLLIFVVAVTEAWEGR